MLYTRDRPGEIRGHILRQGPGPQDREGPQAGKLADVAIYLLGLAEILGFDLEDQVLRKMEINRARRYQVVDGVLRRVQEEDSP